MLLARLYPFPLALLKRVFKPKNTHHTPALRMALVTGASSRPLIHSWPMAAARRADVGHEARIFKAKIP